MADQMMQQQNAINQNMASMAHSRNMDSAPSPMGSSLNQNGSGLNNPIGPGVELPGAGPGLDAAFRHENAVDTLLKTCSGMHDPISQLTEVANRFVGRESKQGAFPAADSGVHLPSGAMDHHGPLQSVVNAGRYDGR